MPRNGNKNLPFKSGGRMLNSFNETKNIQRISEKCKCSIVLISLYFYLAKEDANKMFRMALAIRTIRLKHMKANNLNTN